MYMHYFLLGIANTSKELLLKNVRNHNYDSLLNKDDDARLQNFSRFGFLIYIAL
jgi:hypothetical protein